MEAVWGQCVETLGDNDRTTLNARLLLGVAQRCVGNPEAAAGHMSQALNLLATGRSREARTAAEEVLVVYEERVGDSHPHSPICRLDIATVLARQGHLPRARDLEEQVVNGRERVLRGDHPDTLRCRANLLLTEQELGIQGAAGRRQEVLATLGDLIGAGHPDVTTALRPGGRLPATIDPPPF